MFRDSLLPAVLSVQSHQSFFCSLVSMHPCTLRGGIHYEKSTSGKEELWAVSRSGYTGDECFI